MLGNLQTAAGHLVTLACIHTSQLACPFLIHTNCKMTPVVQLQDSDPVTVPFASGIRYLT